MAKNAISKQEDVNRWPHLNSVKVSSINSDIGLLVGSDVPQALQPLEVRESKNGGPFAVQTALGWVLNGSLGRNKEKIPAANIIKANQTLEQQFRSYCDLDFNNSKYDAKSATSQDDQKALGIMEESATMPKMVITKWLFLGETIHQIFTTTKFKQNKRNCIPQKEARQATRVIGKVSRVYG